MRKLFYLIQPLIISCFVFSINANETMSVRNGLIIIKPVGLSINFKNKNSDIITPITEPSNEHFSEIVSCIKQSDNRLELEYKKNLKVHLWISGDKLNVRIFPQSDQVLTWPYICESNNLKAYLIPEGEGIYIPVNNFDLKKLISKFGFENSSILPFAGFLYNDFTVTIILHTPIRAFLELKNKLSFKYDFKQRDKQTYYELSFTFSKPHVLEPSRIFKSYLKEKGEYVTLIEKIKKNPEIEKLKGAIHAYVWGNGRTDKTLKLLKEIGIERIWIGYEEKPNIIDPWSKTEYVNESFIQLAKDFGYLIGPYDSWHTMTDPKKADCHNVDFGDFFPKGCVNTIEGKIHKGFAGKGCHVSMAALNQINNSIVYQRFNYFKKKGINSYFLDCHATGEVFDDYCSSHSQTVFDDLEIRKKHLKYLSEQSIVLGSETAAYWAIPFLVFSHGNFSTMYQAHYAATKNKNKYGSWWPSSQPQFFFKEIKSDINYAKRYHPSYRIPMWQAVFHESCVATDRWEIPLTKFANLYKDRFLLEFLYGVPSMWHLNINSINKFSNILKNLSQHFTPLHKEIMTEELTNFEYLTEDRTVQKTTFGEKVIITANFREKKFQDIPAKTLKIQWINSGKIEYVEPHTAH